MRGPLEPGLEKLLGIQVDTHDVTTEPKLWFELKDVGAFFSCVLAERRL